MKILWIYKFLAWYNLDKYLHLEFVRTLKKYPGIEVVAYGPDMHSGYPDLTPIVFNPNMSMGDIKRIFPYDIIIVNTKSRAFFDYSPHQLGNYICWLPNDFASRPEPKIMIEEDFHYEKNDDWYVEKNFNLLIQRHHSSFLRKGKVPNTWLPFSVDTAVFKPDPTVERKNKLAYAGSLGGTAYSDRGRAINTLVLQNYLDNLQKVVDDKYVKTLRQYISFLCCSSIYDITASKTFEIMASGAVLLTDHFSGIDELFPEGTCVRFDKSQFDLVDRARSILSDIPKSREIASKGVEHINKFHTHEIRIGQLLNLLKKM